MGINLNELKAKYATTTTATVTATPATPVTPVTETKSTGSFFKSIGTLLHGKALPVSSIEPVYGNLKGLYERSASTVRGAMPVSTNRFENAVGVLTEQTSNLDREVFNNKSRTQVLATATGVVLPTDEELAVLYQQEVDAMRQQVREELLEEQMATLHQEAKEKAEKKAKKAAKKAKKAAKKEAEASMVTITKVTKEIEVDEALVEEARAEINQVAATVLAEEVVAPVKKAKRFQCSTKVDGKRCTKKVTEQNGVCVACQTTVVVEAKEEEVQPAKTSSRRKLGRQAPIAE